MFTNIVRSLYYKKLRIVYPLERWPSGLRRTPGKGVYGELYRGFESLSLRQSKTERWPSGLRRIPGKGVCGEPYREFESLSFRHIYR